MSLFGSIMGDVDEDPFFGSHIRQMRQMNNMMNSLFSSPFGGMGGMGGMFDSSPMALMHAPHAGAMGVMPMMPFMPQMPSLNKLFTDINGGMGAGSSYSSSTVVMSSGPNGKPQVYSTTSSTKIGPDGVKETMKTLQDSRTGTKKMSIVMGKAEGHGENYHGHVTALTVGPNYRRLGLAGTLMSILEDVTEKKNCFFVDLFVRVSNKVAINMYKNLGYIVYRTVLEYYSGDPDEDAYGHHIGERAHLIERAQNLYNGDQEEHQEFINVEEEEAEDFDREFQMKTAQYGRNSGSYHKNRLAPAPRQPQLALPPAPSTAVNANKHSSSPSSRRIKPAARRPIRASASPLTMPNSSMNVRDVYSGLHPQRHRHKASRPNKHNDN